MFRQMIRERRREGTIFLAVFTVVSFLTFMVTRLYATYRNATDVALIRQELSAVKRAQEADREGLRKELDDITRTLYTAALDAKDAKDATQQPQRRPSSAEVYQLNTNKELRDRIHQLELWRLRTKP